MLLFSEEAVCQRRKTFAAATIFNLTSVSVYGQIRFPAVKVCICVSFSGICEGSAA